MGGRNMLVVMVVVLGWFIWWPVEGNMMSAAGVFGEARPLFLPDDPNPNCQPGRCRRLLRHPTVSSHGLQHRLGPARH